MKLFSLIESLVEEVLTEAVPQAPKDSIGGEYLWADPEDDIRRDKIKEPNTFDEKYILDKIRKWYANGAPHVFLNALPTIKKFIEEGYYSKYFLPPKQPVYRYINSLAPKEASEILGVPEEKIKINQGQVTIVDSGGILAPKKPVSSWTIDPTLADVVPLSYPRPKLVSILFEADPSASNNDFYMNPIEIYNTFKPDAYSDFLEMEFEVIGVGPVVFKRAAYYYGPDEQRSPDDNRLPSKKIKNVERELSKIFL